MTERKINYYARGRRFEYEIINKLKEIFPSNKYTIIRTAGSHSPVDVVILKHIGKEYFGIQCKTQEKLKKQYSGK